MSEFIDATATRDEQGHYFIQWHLAKPAVVTVYVSDRVGGEYELLETTEKHSLVVTAPSQQQRLHFLLRTSHAVMPVSERRLALAGTPNLRDFGGYKTRDGKIVKWGHFYRSGKLSALTDTDIAFFNNLGIRKIFDFRRPEEVRRYPTLLVENERLSISNLPIGDGSAKSFDELVRDREITEADLLAGMRSIYHDLAIYHAPTYRKIFDHIITQDTPFLIHCTAGKDRTGMGAALILMALGVDRETILADYLLTSEFYPTDIELAEMRKGFSKRSELLPTLDFLLSVQPEFLQILFEVIDQEYGSEAAYLEGMFGLTDNKLTQLRETWLVG